MLLDVERETVSVEMALVAREVDTDPAEFAELSVEVVKITDVLEIDAEVSVTVEEVCCAVSVGVEIVEGVVEVGVTPVERLT